MKEGDEKMNEENIEELMKREWRIREDNRIMAQMRVDDLQQIYDTVNGSLYQAKAELEEHERRVKTAVDNYEASRGVEE